MSITSKGKGKSGGARVITYTVILAETDAEIKLLTIYDKSERENLTDKELIDLMLKNGLKKNPLSHVVLHPLYASNVQKNNQNQKMKTLETAFEQVVKQHKGTIYTVCLMFSKDTDEVNDLFQEVLINLWKGFGGFEGRRTSAHGFGG